VLFSTDAGVDQIDLAALPPELPVGCSSCAPSASSWRAGAARGAKWKA